MPVILPDFSDPFLFSLGVCFRFSDEAIFTLASEPFRKDTQYGDGFWVQLTEERAREADEIGPNAVHLHLEFRKSFSAGKKPPSTTIDEIESRLEKFIGKSGRMRIRGEFRIPVASRPQTGIVPSMMGISVSADSAKLTLTGATFKYSGEKFDEIQWYVRDDETLIVQVLGAVLSQVSEQFVVSISRILKSGLGLVLEVQAENDESSQESG